MSIIDMQIMRYINLLDRASKVRTRKCFVYNSTIIFAVPSAFMSRAIGVDASNIRSLQSQLEKRVRIIREPNGIKDAEKFILDIVFPIKFKSAEVKGKELIITAGGFQSKAALIGRDKRRLGELRQIVLDSFGLGLKII